MYSHCIVARQGLGNQNGAVAAEALLPVDSFIIRMQLALQKFQGLHHALCHRQPATVACHAVRTARCRIQGKFKLCWLGCCSSVG
jgi:hypothetical protein